MDDNNYMNNDNRSSGTPDNTGVFGAVFRNSKMARHIQPAAGHIQSADRHI